MRAIVQEPHLVDLVQFAGLRRDVCSGESQTLPEICRPAPVDELANNFAVIVLVKLVEEDAVESAEVLDYANNDVQKVLQVLSAAKLVIDLVEDREDVESIRNTAGPRAAARAASASTSSVGFRSALDRRPALTCVVPEIAELALHTNAAERLGMICRRCKDTLQRHILALSIDSHGKILAVVVHG